MYCAGRTVGFRYRLKRERTEEYNSTTSIQILISQTTFFEDIFFSTVTSTLSICTVQLRISSSIYCIGQYAILVRYT